MGKKIAIFASGSGSNAENIIKYFENNKSIEFPIIISNKSNAYVHRRAEKLCVDSITVDSCILKDGQELLKVLNQYDIDYIVLAGYLLKIPSEVVKAFPNKIVNIHPALLPKYGGKGMYGDNVHKAVKEMNEKETGITIHYVNENYDEGNIIFQAKCEVLTTDSYQEIAQRVHELEYQYFPKIIQKIWF